MRRGRLGLLLFIAAALILVASPIIVTWWVQRDACPRVSVSSGWLPGTILYDISRADCGRDFGTVWQVRVANGDGFPRIAYDARNGPVPIAVTGDNHQVTIRLDAPPVGKDADTIVVPLDNRGRPQTTFHFVDGSPR